MIRVAVIIPALNESMTVRSVVANLVQQADVIVVDDGLTDDTASLAKLAGADVVVHVGNQGYDRALESGLLRAVERGHEFAVTMDADGQHRPEALRSFVDALQAGADVVIGIRDRRQRWAEELFGLIAQALWRIRDPLCGMKGYRLSVIARAVSINTYGSIGTELLLRAARSNCRITQVEVPTASRSDTARFGNGVRANLRILRALLLGLLWARPLPALGEK